MVCQSMASTFATFVLSFSSRDFYIISRLRAVAMIGIGVAHVGGQVQIC